MGFKIEAIEELNFIRAKVSRRDLDYTEQEFQCLTEVYKEIGRHYGQNYTLNKSCNGCVRDAMNIVYNYINFHEIKEPVVKREAKVTVVTTHTPEEEVKMSGLEDLTLPNLRRIYPTIKARSKKDFIKRVREYEDK